MSNKKLTKLISCAGIVLALLAVLLILSSVVAAASSAEGGDVTCTVSGNLTISNVSASNIGYHSATISWKTNDNATSQVFYDTASHDNITAYAYHTTEDTALVTEHSIPLTGLSSGTTYHYRVRSAIPDTEFTAISEDYTFKTLTPAAGVAPPPTYYTKTDLFGIESRFRTSDKGKILQTIEATSEDGMLTVTIPRGTIALDKDGKRLKGLEAAVDESPPGPPEDAHIIGLPYDFGPAGASFDPPITLEYTYDPADIPEGVAEQDLVLAYYDMAAGEWIELDCVVDTENNTITASVAHFTTFAIIGAVAPEIPALKQAIDALRAEIASLQADLAAAEALVASLQDNVDSAQTKVASSQYDLAAAQARSTSLRSELATAESNLAAAQDELARLEAPPAPIIWPIIIAVVVAVVVVAIVFFWIRRKREKDKGD